MIVAASENNVIGFENKIPWKISEDLKHFVELTVGHPVIIGRKTYLSISEKFRPLPNRKNIILSSTFESEDKIIYIARDLPEAIKFTENKESYVIGGAVVYAEFLPLIKKIELTRIHRHYEGNIFLPIINWDNWRLISEKKGVSEKDGIPYSFLSYVRKI